MIDAPLSDRDYKILNLLYIDAMPVTDIARVTQVDRSYISRLLSREEVQPLVNEFIKLNEAELSSLELKATEVLRTHMDSESEDIQNKAVDKVYRRLGKYKESKDINITVEDVLRTYLSSDSDEGLRPDEINTSSE